MAAFQHFGFDAASFQHPNGAAINWAAAAAYLRELGGGAQPFLIVKENQGTGYANSYAKMDLSGAIAAGFAVAGYLFDNGSESPSAQQNTYLRLAGSLPEWLDAENPQGLTVAAYSQHIQADLSLNAVEGIYLNDTELNGMVGAPWGHPLWLAWYNPVLPKLPAGVRILMWQSTSTATIPGVVGHVDLDRWMGTEAEFAKAFSNVITATTGADTVVPPPAPPVNYPGDAVNRYNLNVEIVGGLGWAPLPPGVTADKVVNVLIQGMTPGDPAVGKYVPVPAFVSVSTDVEGALEFGPGAYGPAPDNMYGFTLWTTTD